MIDDLFGGDFPEQAVLEKHKVRRSTYDKWLEDKLFAERFKKYVNGLKRRGELLMAKYSCLAAAKLVELTASGKEETARKACLDIISPPTPAAQKAKQSNKAQKDGSGAEGQAEQLPPQTASRLLAALAEERRQKTDDRRKKTAKQSHS